MKRLSIGIALVLVVASVAAVVLWPRGTGATTASRVVRIPLENDIETLDPATLKDPITSRVVWQIYEGLVGLNARNEVVPMIAESWESREGGRTWVFHVRKDVFFHSHPAFGGANQSRVVRADDVVWSYGRMAKGFGSFVFQGLIEGFDSYVKGEATTISGITAAGERDVTFKLTRPDPSFVYRITSPYLSIMPREVVEANPDAFGRTVAIGTGPFRLAQASATEVALERNPRYWRASTGNIDRLVFRVEKNPQFRVAGLQAGNYDLLQLPAESRSQFLNGSALQPALSDKFRVFTGQTFNVHYLGIDAKQVTDPALRRAISLAINRDAIASRLLSGGAVSARGPIPPGMQGYTSPMKSWTDRESAKRELAKSEYRGEVLPILVSNAPNHSDVAQLVQKDLNECGIKTRIDSVDFNTLVTRLFGKDRPQLFMAYSEWIYAAPELIMEQFRSTATPNPNLFGYSDDRVDALLSQLASASDRAGVTRLCAEIETIVDESPPAAWLYSETHSFIAARRLSNFALTGNNHWLLGDLRSDP